MKENNSQNNVSASAQIAVNMVFSILAFVLNLMMSFFVTPYITNKFGSEAYGFVKLANDFTSYAALFSIALNSMASRFLMIERANGRSENLRKYHSSLMLANIVLSGIFIVPSILCVLLLDNLLSIPVALVVEVKLTFIITFIAFLVNFAFSTFSNCYYLTNKLSIASVRDTFMNLIKAAAIIMLFAFGAPKISYVAVGSLVSTVFVVIYNIVYTKKLLPDLKFNASSFDWEKLKQLLAAGIWNSITKLSQIFSSGLDLLIANLFIGTKEMGYLAVAKTVPNIIVSFNSTVANVFSPNMMELYAKGEVDALKQATKTAVKFMCLFVAIPNAILIVMGEAFYSLWVPDQPSRLLCLLSILTVINSCITGPIGPLYQVFTITNKVKQSSIILIIYGFCCVLGSYTLLSITDLGVFSIVIVSLVGSVIVSLGYHLPFSAIYIGLPWYTFYPEIAKSVLSLAVQCVIGFVVTTIIPVGDSWVMWFLGAFAATIAGAIANAFIILDQQERRTILEKFMRSK